MPTDESDIEPRRGMPSPKLPQSEFRTRFMQSFRDPAFDEIRQGLEKASQIAWNAYTEGRKAPFMRAAGAEFSDPTYELSTDWIAAREAIQIAERKHQDASQPRVLLINGSPRTEHTCPGEMSKSWRLIDIAQSAMTERHACDIDILDLSRTTSEYGRTIHPCKACFSTAAPLCHWPCSCYPNYALGQAHDWMNEIYPLWVAAHGIMIVTPVHWYQATSPLKLMIDRLVCGDGGNPDPTSTQGKNAKLGKQMEVAGWDYPRHLEGRLFSLVVHGDVEGAENLRRALADWLSSLHLAPAGTKAQLDRYIGYWKPYATSHAELDRDQAVQDETANAARTLIDALIAQRGGHLAEAGSRLPDPRQK